MGSRRRKVGTREDENEAGRGAGEERFVEGVSMGRGFGRSPVDFSRGVRGVSGIRVLRGRGADLDGYGDWRGPGVTEVKEKEA